MALTGSLAKYAGAPSCTSGSSTGCCSVIIRDTGIRQVDGYPFYTQTSSAACLAHIQHQIRLAKFDLAHHFCGAAGKACRDLPLDDLRPGNFIRQHFNSFVSRVDAFPSERVKACN